MHFLEFDPSASADGAASFEAMASVPGARWPELEREIMQLLAWARAQGECAALEEGGDWDLDLSLRRETSQTLRAEPDWTEGRLRCRPLAGEVGDGDERMAVVLTLSASPALAEVFRQRLMGDQ